MRTPFSTSLFEQLPIVGILRGLALEQIPPVVEAVVAGGLTNLEVTMNTLGAAEQIRAACDTAGNRMNIGAGTVTNVKLLQEALDAGARFIVMPIVAPDVIQRCVQLGVPIFPGACTPTEILRGWELGATMVKIFPADVLGPGFVRALKGPLPQVKVMPTGGVDVNTIGQYIQAGADGFGVGSPLFRADRLAANGWGWISEQTQALAAAYRTARQHRSG